MSDFLDATTHGAHRVDAEGSNKISRIFIVVTIIIIMVMIARYTSWWEEEPRRWRLKLVTFFLVISATHTTMYNTFSHPRHKQS